MEGQKMSKIERYEINEQWAHSGIVKAGDFCYLSHFQADAVAYCG